MKEIDKHVLGRKTYKLNPQEAAIKPPGAGQLWVLLSASLCKQLPAAALSQTAGLITLEQG